jgi:hypothetical protein
MPLPWHQRSGMNHMAKAHHDDNPPRTNQSDADASMEQIREILFGGRVREIELRFAELEARIEQQYAALGQAFEQGLAHSERELRQSIDGLSAVLGEARSQDRGEVEQRLAQLDADLNDGHAVLRRDLEERAMALQEHFSAEQAELRQMLEAQIKRLGGEKLDGAVLADMLQNVAARLRQSTSD